MPCRAMFVPCKLLAAPADSNSVPAGLHRSLKQPSLTFKQGQEISLAHVAVNTHILSINMINDQKLFNHIPIGFQKCHTNTLYMCIVHDVV